MTLALAPVAAADVRESLRTLRQRSVVQHVTVLAVLLWWAIPLTRGDGGRDRHLLSVGLLLAAAAYVAVRPWRTVPRREQLLAAVVVAAAFAVCLVAPTGWAGANEAGTWTFASISYLCVRGYAKTGDRRHVVTAAVVVAGVAEFAAAWLPWWGSADPSRPMIGTLYWHNQYAAFLLAPALLAVSLAVWPRRQTRMLGWLGAPLCSAGVLFSTSRATLGLLVLGWVALAGAAVWFPGRRGAISRLTALAVLTLVTAFSLTGPPFFAHRAAPSSGVAEREADQSAGGNAAWRTVVWREAVTVYKQHPVAGTGFHGFGSAASAATPGKPHSAFAHDVWLQSFAEGGTIFGLPVLIATLLALRRVGLGVIASIRKVRSPAALAVGVAVLLLGAHSLVDFDMSYPTLAAMTAVLLALAASGEVRPQVLEAEVPESAARLPWIELSVAALLLAAAAIAVAPAWDGILHFNVAVAGGAPVPGEPR